MADRLLGKEVTASFNEQLKERVNELKKQGITPLLEIIRVGEDPGDLSYERGAMKRCETIGVSVRNVVLTRDVTQDEMLRVMDEANEDPSVHGVLLLRPLPKHLDASVIENRLRPEKDVDCMTDLSISGVFSGRNIGYPPCTAQACIEILDHYGIDCTGKKAVVVGRSLVVGKPVSMMLLQKNATVTICHTRTKDLSSVTKDADILIVAAGKAGVIGAEHVREGQIVIDVGINTDEDGKLCGDVKFSEAEKIAGYITPVPGGVGSVTTSVLVRHVVDAAMRKS